MTTGFGGFDTTCPDHGRHKWMLPGTPGRECEYCGVSAREHLDNSTAARAAFFQTLRAPASAHGRAAKK